MNVVLCTGEIALLFSCQCSPRSVKTSKFEMKLSNKASQNTIKSSFFWFCSLPSRYNYNALKDASFISLVKLFSISIGLKEEVKEEERKKGISDGEGIYRNK